MEAHFHNQSKLWDKIEIMTIIVIYYSMIYFLMWLNWVSMVYGVKFDHLWTSYLDSWCLSIFLFLFHSLFLPLTCCCLISWTETEAGRGWEKEGVSWGTEESVWELRWGRGWRWVKEIKSNQITHLAAILDQTAAVLAFWDHSTLTQTTWTQMNLVFYQI